MNFHSIKDVAKSGGATHIIPTTYDRYWYVVYPKDNKRYKFHAKLSTFSDGQARIIDRIGINIEILPTNAIAI